MLFISKFYEWYILAIIFLRRNVQRCVARIEKKIQQKIKTEQTHY